MPAGERQQIINSTETGRIDDVDAYASFVSANSGINKAAREDGYGLAVNQGLIDPIPFNRNDPVSFQNKLEQASNMSQHYGVPVSPLSRAEVQGLVRDFPEMTPGEKIQLAVSFNAAPAIWGQISKDGGGTFAMAGASGDVNVMNSVFRGEELIAAKLAKPIKSSDFLGDFQDHVGNVYGTEDARNVMNAAVAYYAANFDQEGEYRPKNFEEAIDAVTGGFGEYNSYKYELPRGADENDFNDLVEQMAPETVEALGGVYSMSAETAAEVIGRARVVNAKNGVYRLQVNGGYLMRADDPKMPFTFEWSDELANRNKGFLGSKYQGFINDENRGGAL